ncbi:hypothetical protein QE152_g6621 [Popillia japonica]|uniref:DNA-directed DNA polymerase n=1 Tax=Popillia japonica TaxID=7064 RepID=A0AAW1MDX0_POPJA
MERRYEDTCAKTERLREAGYEVIEGWECDFRNTMTDEIKAYRENHELLRNTPLNSRDAFYGGRTGASKMYHTVVEDEKINDEQRALTGTWVIDEVRKSIEKGYSVLEIYEVWKYHVVNGLFKEYIDEYLKIKQQATGWPLGCDSTEEKQKYIQQYLEKEGVKLNPDKIAKNPGLRQVGKAVITSFWGKLGQRENQSKTTIVNEPAQFFSLLTNPTINVNTVQTINENTLVVNWEHKEEVYDPLPTVNVCLAAYTTAQARLKLYSYLEKHDDRVLYYDTDSVIYKIMF